MLPLTSERSFFPLFGIEKPHEGTEIFSSTSQRMVFAEFGIEKPHEGTEIRSFFPL